MTAAIRHALTTLGVWTSHPLAFPMVPIYGVLWFIFGRSSFRLARRCSARDMFMTLVIQRAEHRDTQAIHAKLDELLHAQGTASNKMTNIDKEDTEEIETHRKVGRPND